MIRRMRLPSARRSLLALFVTSPILILAMLIAGWAGLILIGIAASLIVAVWLEEES